ncbi:hypothetical protein QF028_003531 [Neobacillus sp. B4I6]
MEIKKTKFVQKSQLTKCKPVKRSRVMKLRQEKFKAIIKVGNTTGIIHSELMRLTSDERRQWFEKEAERGNPVLLELQRLVRESYFKRMQRGNVE